MSLAFKYKKQFVQSTRDALASGKKLDDYTNLSPEVRAAIRAKSQTTAQINSSFAIALEKAEREKDKDKHAVES